jgi:hypothetical protein
MLKPLQLYVYCVASVSVCLSQQGSLHEKAVAMWLLWQTWQETNPCSTQLRYACACCFKLTMLHLHCLAGAQKVATVIPASFAMLAASVWYACYLHATHHSLFGA